MAQVTFPTYLGGSGNTYSDDDNPNTGLANDGHRVRFVPLCAEVLAMGLYVYQYAAKIDNAAANAVRAEDARGYVEAVADAYKVNLLDQFKRKATLGLDFSQGVYFFDDGAERVSTTDPNGIFNVNRTTPKWSDGPGGGLAESPAGALTRSWLFGEGALLSEATSTNPIAHNTDIDTSAGLWEKSAALLDTVNEGGGYWLLSGDASAGNLYVRPSLGLNVTAGQVYTFTGRFKPKTADSLIVYLGDGFVFDGTNVRVNINSDLTMNVIFNSQGANVYNLFSKKCLDGSVFFAFTAECFTSRIERPLYYASTKNNSATPPGLGQGEMLSLGWVQCEPSEFFSSPIVTGAGSVSRSPDSIDFSLPAGAFSRQEGAWYVEFYSNIPESITTGARDILTPTGSSVDRLLYIFGGNRVSCYDGNQLSFVSVPNVRVGKKISAVVSLFDDGTMQVIANGVSGSRVPHNGKFLFPSLMNNVMIHGPSFDAAASRPIKIYYSPQSIAQSVAEAMTAGGAL